jgi:sigma-B regulation protein RsbU (phosphoserine phosphatase)
MESGFFDRIRDNLLIKRQNVTSWLAQAPAPQRHTRLGPAQEAGVHAHLRVIEDTISQASQPTFGLCVVCHDPIEPEVLEMDYTATVCLDHLSVKARRQLEDELELSQVVQRALLPQAVPDIPGLEVAAFSRPAQIVGGDYFDFVHFRDGAYGLAIADVAGHGMAAGLLMASIQTALRTLVPLSDSPGEVMQRVNQFFCHNIHMTTFVTLFLGRFDSQSHTVQYANAGHNPPLHVHRNGTAAPTTWLRPTAAAIGLVEEYAVRERSMTMAEGDVLLLYTDGVTEASNVREEEFGAQRLADVVLASAHAPARDLVRAVRSAVEAFVEGRALDDDTTILACKTTGFHDVAA